jgi:5-methylthioadenosine/S-adenosylhomocysteine deaminase
MPNVSMIVRAGRLVPAHDQATIHNGAVAIDGNIIIDVGPYDQVSKKYHGVPTIGGEDFLLIPGLINGHGHGRGLSDFQRGAIDNTLESWLLSTRNYTPISAFDDIAYSAARLIKSGVTTTMHNHILGNPGHYEKEFDESLQAYKDAGMRVQFNPGIRNDNPFVYGDNKNFLSSLPDHLQRLLTAPSKIGSLNGDNFVKVVSDLYARYDNPMSKIGFGPLAPQWCTKELLVEIRRAADHLGAPIHIHALQSIFQKIYGLKSLGKTLIEYMKEIGFLGKGLTIGHCVWPTESDIELLAKTGTAVTHHPSCNLRVRNGIAPVVHMLQAGVVVGLGIDGKSINDDDDMIEEMKQCFLLHRIPSLDLDSPHLSSRQVFRMATHNNAMLLGYDRDLGRLEPGRLADMVLLNYREMCHPFVDSCQDPIDTILYRGTGRHVHTVLINGTIVLRDGKLLTLDEETLENRLVEQASRPKTDKEKEFARAMNELRAHVVKYYSNWIKEMNVVPFFTINSRINGNN